jgi:hypothetical protein
MPTAFLAISLAALLQQDAPRPAKEFPVKMTVVADKPAGGTQKILVMLTIEKPYYIFANPSGIPDFDETKLSVAGKAARVAYPVGELVKDEAIGDYRVYRGTVTLQVAVERKPEDTDPIEIRVQVRPLDEKGCFWQQRTLKATVP